MRGKSRWKVKDRKKSLEKLREEKVAGKSKSSKSHWKVSERKKSLESRRERKKSLKSQR